MKGKNPEPLEPVWRKLRRLLKNGVPLPEALEAVARETSDVRLGESLAEIARRVRECGDVGEAIEKYPDLFSESLSSLVRRAEQAGKKMESVLGDFLETLTAGAFRFPGGGKKEEPVEDEETEEEKPSKPVAILDKILEGAADERASDVHFIPTETGGKVRYRIDGVMHDRTDLEKRDYENVLWRIKLLAGLDVTDKIRPQDGRFMTDYRERRIDCRVSFAAAAKGETAVLRFLDPYSVRVKLDEIIPGESIPKTFRRWMAAPSGLVIVSGPTGSGKTTVLYSLLREVVGNPALKILSVEESVEYTLENVVQLPVRRAQGVTQPHLIRSVMRQDPDVLLIGEVRDRETPELAVDCALTGHLVLTSMHGQTSTEIVVRLCDMGVSWRLLRDSLLGVSAQRLVRILCKKCREEYEIPESVVRDIPVPHPEGPVKAWRAKGCEACKNTGYRGRTAIVEQFEPKAEFWKVLERGESEERLREVAIEEGLETMWVHGWNCVRTGETSIQEVGRVLGMAQL